jgi:hypothetical protein
MAQATRTGRIRRRGRTLGVVVFSLLVASFTAVWTVQICLQVWAPRVPEGTFECRPGVTALFASLELAREAAAQQNGEQAALAAFRSGLARAWEAQPALLGSCRSDRVGAEALHEVTRLRYAEEHAVRYEAHDLAPRRRLVDTLIPQLK